MVEVKQENVNIGVFDVCNLQHAEVRERILQVVSSKKFFILIFNKECAFIKEHPIVQRMEEKGCVKYAGIAITINGNGMSNFKDTFHRSSTHVDQRMFPYKDFKKLFEDNEEILNFINYLNMEYGEFQIKGMKNIFLRDKVDETQPM